MNQDKAEKPDPAEPVDDRIFDETIFKEHLRNKLILLIDSIPGKKILLLDSAVAGPLNLSAEHSLLKEHGIHKIYYLESDDLDAEINQIIFFVYPKVLLMKKIARIIHKNSQDKNYHLVFWPRRTILCKEALESFGVYGNLDIRDFNFDLIPLDTDLLSLELNTCFKELYIENDLSTYTYVAESLQRLQLVYGKIRSIFAKGNGPKVVLEILRNYETEGKKFDDNAKGDIESLIILDRNIDFITPLCTQLTYNGLIDEIFEIKNNMVKLDPAILNKEGDKQIPMLLTSNDSVFKEIRDLNFNVLRRLLSEKVDKFKKVIDEKNKERTVQEMNVYIQKFKKVQKEYPLVTNHINIADKISTEMKTISFYRNLSIEQGIIIGAKTNQSLDHLEVLIGLQRNLNKILRLLSLQSLVDNGLKAKTWDFFRREILQSYGFDNLLLLNNLEKVGLIKKLDNKSNWSNLEKTLRLINEDVTVENPNDCAYSYSGYAPITARLVENTFKKYHWKNIQEALKILPGPTIFDEKLNISVESKRNIVLVYMIGGITFDKEILIATTNVVNGNQLIASLNEKFDLERDQGSIL